MTTFVGGTVDGVAEAPQDVARDSIKTFNGYC